MLADMTRRGLFAALIAAPFAKLIGRKKPPPDEFYDDMYRRYGVPCVVIPRRYYVPSDDFVYGCEEWRGSGVPPEPYFVLWADGELEIVDNRHKKKAPHDGERDA